MMKLPSFVERGIVLAPYTSYRVGGPAAYFCVVSNYKQLKESVAFAKAHYLEVFIFGRGTNLLVSDSGYHGMVVRLARDFSRILIDGENVVAGGGAQLALAASAAARSSLSGLEWAAGIPGTIGGAVKMNAGAHGFSVADLLVDVLVFDVESGELLRKRASELELGYRSSGLSQKEVILEATFKLKEGDPERIKQLTESYFEERKAKQPLGQRSAGSVFKNPPGDFAARLIEKAGLKGKRLGGAQVSNKHANFIVNLGDATAEDIYNLMKMVQQEVYNQFKVLLEPEIILVGDF
jgi:UDP-N-acetylmuramate dehydrogenase